MTLIPSTIVSALLYPNIKIIGIIGRMIDNQVEIIRADGTSAGFTPQSMVRFASVEEQRSYYDARERFSNSN